MKKREVKIELAQIQQTPVLVIDKYKELLRDMRRERLRKILTMPATRVYFKLKIFLTKIWFAFLN